VLLVEYMGEIRNGDKFGQNPKERRVYEKLQARREDNIKMCCKGGLHSFC